MDNQPTSPPWKAVLDYISPSGFPAAVMTREGELVAEVSCSPDALLIAATPLLLDACEAVLKEDELSGGQLLSRQSYLLVRAALLKARQG
jgi:hypothetical protein